MPSTYQSGGSTEYDSSYERQLELWPDDWLLILEPMTKEAAIGYWNAANKMGCSDDVKAHFKEAMQRYR